MHCTHICKNESGCTARTDLLVHAVPAPATAKSIDWRRAGCAMHDAAPQKSPAATCSPHKVDCAPAARLAPDVCSLPSRERGASLDGSRCVMERIIRVEDAVPPLSPVEIQLQSELEPEPQPQPQTEPVQEPDPAVRRNSIGADDDGTRDERARTRLRVAALVAVAAHAPVVRSGPRLLNTSDSWGALDKKYLLKTGEQEAPAWTWVGLAWDGGRSLACWCCSSGLVLALVYGSVVDADSEQRTRILGTCLLELSHGLNGVVVKQTRHWLASELDSCVIHTLLYINNALYLRTPTWFDVLFFIVVRALAEHFPTNIGGLISIKSRSAAQNVERKEAAEDKAEPSMLRKCFWLSLTYAVWYVLSHAVLLREHTLNLQFLLTLIWAFPMTLMIASHYLYTKADWSFYVAHMANVITLST
eukprot:SAG25_NODE_1759_length_2385_cov_154.022544_2_plen_416_part_01